MACKCAGNLGRATTSTLSLRVILIVLCIIVSSLAVLNYCTLCGLLRNQALDKKDNNSMVFILLNLKMLIRESLQLVYNEFTLPAG